MVDWLSGCCLLLRKKVVGDIGFLSEDFFMYGEDLEWCYRAKKNGYEIWYVPISQIKHLNRGSNLNNMPNLLLASRKMVYEKTFGIPRGLIITGLTVINCLIKLTWFMLKFKNGHLNLVRNIKIALKEEIKAFRLLINSFIGVR